MQTVNILIIGSGGRENVLAWKVKQSPFCGELYIAPGNAGTGLFGKNLPIEINNFSGLRNAVIEYKIELIIVGPEEPLVKGIVDYIASDPVTKNVQIIGPNKLSATLEGSKAFAKAFMQRHKIPTPVYKKFSAENYLDGVAYIKEHALPIVLKADGLAAGKGVLICQSHIEALAEFELMILRSKFGEAGKKVVVEEFLEGTEISVFVLTNGKDYLLLPEAKDYKRIGEGDTGLNTGGMGAVSPLPFFSKELKQNIQTNIIDRTLAGLKEEGMGYKGFLFFGLMMTGDKPYVIEYNCRLGDPETQVVIPRIKNDLVEILLMLDDPGFGKIKLQTDPRCAVAVVAASAGYPGDYEKGKVILGLGDKQLEGSIVFQAGTIMEEGDVVTNGGRVLAVTSFGNTISEAAGHSIQVLEDLYFEEMVYRSDIGYEFNEAENN